MAQLRLRLQEPRVSPRLVRKRLGAFLLVGDMRRLAFRSMVECCDAMPAMQECWSRVIILSSSKGVSLAVSDGDEQSSGPHVESLGFVLPCITPLGAS